MLTLRPQEAQRAPKKEMALGVARSSAAKVAAKSAGSSSAAGASEQGPAETRWSKQEKETENREAKEAAAAMSLRERFPWCTDEQIQAVRGLSTVDACQALSKIAAVEGLAAESAAAPSTPEQTTQSEEAHTSNEVATPVGDDNGSVEELRRRLEERRKQQEARRKATAATESGSGRALTTASTDKNDWLRGASGRKRQVVVLPSPVELAPRLSEMAQCIRIDRAALLSVPDTRITTVVLSGAWQQSLQLPPTVRQVSPTKAQIELTKADFSKLAMEIIAVKRAEVLAVLPSKPYASPRASIFSLICAHPASYMPFLSGA